MIGEHLFEGNILSDGRTKHKLDAHAFKNAASGSDDLVFKFEHGDAKGEQSANLRVFVIDDGLNTIACQDICTGQTRRARPDHRYFPAGGNHVGQIGPPAPGKRGIGNVPFNCADRDCAVTGIQGARALAQAIMGTNTPAYLRQAVGLVRQFRRFDDAVFGSEFQPVGYVIVNGAFPLAVGITAGDTALALLFALTALERFVNLPEFVPPRVDVVFFRFSAIAVRKFKQGSDPNLFHD